MTRKTSLLPAAILAPAALAVLAAAVMFGNARRGRPIAGELAEKPPTQRLPDEQQAGWSRVVAALQQVAEEHPEALELEQTELIPPRLQQLGALLDETALLVARLGGSSAPEIGERLASIRRRVVGADYTLSDDCRALAARIFESKPLLRSPVHKPDLARGKRVFAESCAACHGKTGSGGSALAATMNPPPADVLHPQYNWTPYDMFNRVTYGGVETAMPSFEQGLSAAERWDVVFYLFAERWPACKQPLPPLGADELALLGDFELSNRFPYGAAACLRREYLAPREPR